jgi:hypothetical protein
MYGDSGVMRRHTAQIRELAADIRAMADQLVSQTEGIAWAGRAADAMRERIRDRAAGLREVATAHDTAADSLERHAQTVETLKETIALTERKAARLSDDTTPEDETLTTFTPPPPGHKDWLTVTLPGR